MPSPPGPTPLWRGRKDANGSFLLVLGLGGARVASGAMNIGEFVAFLLYVSFLLMPLVAIFAGMSAVQKGRAALCRVVHTMALEPEPAEETGADRNTVTPAGDPASPALELRDVRFGYDDAREVLSGLSLTVTRHQHTALVGPSGAGKSTVFALVERFYEGSAGTILLDGRDITSLPVDQLRAFVGYVQQEAPLMAGTLRDNLTFARPDADPDELAEVIRVTNLDEVVDRLPGGLDTEVGEHGSMLSGGERQRVAIARALLPRPRLLLLDEPTAHLDAANEESLTQLIGRLCDWCTVVTVAHRSSTVRAADQILVLDEGRVIAAGTHDDLLATSEQYRSLAARAGEARQPMPVRPARPNLDADAGGTPHEPPAPHRSPSRRPFEQGHSAVEGTNLTGHR